MAENDTVSIAVAQVLCMGMRGAGYDPAPVLQEVGIDPVLLTKPEARLPHHQIVDLWRRAPDHTGDPYFGLRGAEFLHNTKIAFGSVDMIDYLGQVSATTGDALQQLARYSALLRQELIEFTLQPDAETTRLVLRLLKVPGGTLPHATECSLAAVALGIRSSIGHHWAPLRVEFQHPAPSSADEHHRVFGSDVAFEQPLDCLVIAREALDEPFASADPRLRQLLERQASTLLAALPKATDLIGRLQRKLVEIVHSDDLSIETVAHQLGVGIRTLQRRLKDGGLTYKHVVDRVRQQEAIRLLDEGKLSLAEIAFLLGFSGPSTFHRAFKRWTGSTPRSRHSSD